MFGLVKLGGIVGGCAYLEPGGTRLQAGEVSGKNTSLVELTRAHQAISKLV